MKLPQIPPELSMLIARLQKPEAMMTVIRAGETIPDRGYLHWDELRRRPLPEGVDSYEMWWLILKMRRAASYRWLSGLLDKKGHPFVYSLPDEILRLLHQVDFHSGAMIGVEDTVLNKEELEKKHLVGTLIEEAITSSQLEGAATTRRVAKELIRSGRAPRDKSERMIRNNYLAMKEIVQRKNEPLTPELVFHIHRIITEGTLENPDAAGRFRTEQEPIHVIDDEGTVYHEPPVASELPERMKRLCAFANEQECSEEAYIPPVIRAILLHFWLAYDHPFVDGNGRVARALFYWGMLKQGFWLFEFVSISDILLKAKTQYTKAYLHTETDANDLTYFILYQMDVIQRALLSLHAFIKKRQKSIQDTAQWLSDVPGLNNRQYAILAHSIRYPDAPLTIKVCQQRHHTAYATTRADLLDLAQRGFFIQRKRGKEMLFYAVLERLKKD